MKKRQVPKLNKKISIYSKAGVNDGLGGVDHEETLICQPWAAIWPVGAKETRENMRTEATITHNIRIWFRPGITHKMKIVFGSREFEIFGIINPDESNRFLDLVCEEKPA